MRSTLPVAALVLVATSLPNAVQAQATHPLPPGVYFLWSPPGPQTTTPENPVGPNFNWVAEQTGRPTVVGLSSPGQIPSLLAAGPVRSATGRAALREAPFLFGRMWYRLVTSSPTAPAPDLWTSGTDYATAGRRIAMWIPNEGIDAGDQVFVSVRVDRSSPTRPGAAPVSASTTGALPPGGFGSKVHFDLDPLLAGEYRVTIEAWDPGSGLSRSSTRRLVVR